MRTYLCTYSPKVGVPSSAQANLRGCSTAPASEGAEGHAAALFTTTIQWPIGSARVQGAGAEGRGAARAGRPPAQLRRAGPASLSSAGNAATASRK
eukprot:scaffold5312_cov118-Isochrysis_galbana.AAC.8